MLYIIYRDFKLEFQYHSIIKMCGVFEIFGIFLYHETIKQAMWAPFALKLALKWEILRFYIALLEICSAFEIA